MAWFRQENTSWPARLPVGEWDSPVPVFAMVPCALGITVPLEPLTLPVGSAFSCVPVIGRPIITALVALEMRRSFVGFIQCLEETAIPLRFNLGRTGIVLYTFSARATVASG